MGVPIFLLSTFATLDRKRTRRFAMRAFEPRADFGNSSTIDGRNICLNFGYCSHSERP
jgi:hypothetical protein